MSCYLKITWISGIKPKVRRRVKMNEQMVILPRKNSKPGCSFSKTPAAETWMVHLNITESDRLPFIYCDQCSRPTCYRRSGVRIAHPMSA